MQIHVETMHADSDIQQVRVGGLTVIHNGTCKNCEEWPTDTILLKAGLDICVACANTAWAFREELRDLIHPLPTAP